MAGAPPPQLDADDFFADVTFADLTLEGGDLSGKEFQRCRFLRCKLAESRWTRVKLEDSVFVDCDLTRMTPRELALRTVSFEGTRLMGVDWSEIARLPQIAFERCDLRYSSFVKVRLPDIHVVGCLAREANFLEVDLTGADFSDTDLTGATISGCTLVRANFARAQGVLFDPQKNRVRDARISLDTAVLLAQSTGFVVEGFEPPGG
jgi:fluoroquinolone resistance protein